MSIKIKRFHDPPLTVSSRPFPPPRTSPPRKLDWITDDTRFETRHLCFYFDSVSGRPWLLTYVTLVPPGTPPSVPVSSLPKYLLHWKGEGGQLVVRLSDDRTENSLSRRAGTSEFLSNQCRLRPSYRFPRLGPPQRKIRRPRSLPPQPQYNSMSGFLVIHSPGCPTRTQVSELLTTETG